MKTNILRYTLRFAVIAGLLGANLVLADDERTAADLTITTDEDVAVTFSVIPAGDDDDDKKGKGKGKGKKKDQDDDDEGDDNVSLLSITQPGNGTASDNGDGTITYTPNADYNGADAFSYTLSWRDGDDNDTATGAINVTVNPVNDDPVAADDQATTAKGTPVTIDVLANDTDIDGGTLSVQNTRQARGTVHINADGSLLYTPTPNFTGVDDFFYTVIDGNGGSDEGVVVVTVSAGPANREPVAQDDTGSTDEDTAVTLNVLANDSDPDGDALSVSGVTQGSNGSVVNNGGGTVTYTPAANFNGSDAFSYTISDGNGGSASANVTITITAVNDAPVASGQAVSTGEDQSVAITLSAFDVDGDALSYSIIAGPDQGQLSGTAPLLTYTPDENFNGNDAFTFEASDGTASDQAVVTISVGAANDFPVAVDDNAGTAEDTPVTIDVLANDSDPDGDALSVSGVTQGSNGSVVNNGDGTVTYTPDENFNGSDAFSYTVSDGNGGSASAGVNVSVTAVNDTPVAVDDVAATNEDVQISIDVLTNDIDVDGDALTVKNVRQHNGIVHIQADGTLLYEPTPNFSGQDIFFYTVQDGHEGEDEGQVTVTVGGVNDAPVAADDIASTAEDTPVTIDVLANDSDVDGDALSVSGATQGSNGSVAVNDDGTVTYTPEENFNGSDAF
ncbi:MAG: tandem-95 repeat protein, partial [Candidatus Marinimicrobia bacterium]|nr:tandem-95 repeat protein [Candidatus Neomarinimicrobiota bacterium]